MSEHLYTFTDPINEKDVDKAIAVLENDGIIAYPTDFNFAFGCDATKPALLEKIKLLKPDHPKERPFGLLCSSMSMVSEVANIDNWAYRLLKKAWPGPYTILLPSSRSLPKQIHDKRKVVGVRVPKNPLLLAIVEKFGKPLATTSVPNVTAHDSSGQLVQRPPQFGYEVYEKFGHGIDLLLDLGDEVSGEESSVVDMSEDSPEIVREGVGDTKIFT